MFKLDEREMFHVVLPYLIISTLFIHNNTLYVASGPKLFVIDLVKGTYKSFDYLQSCGSFICIPFCVGMVNDTVVLGTSGSLLKFENGTFKHLIGLPVISCNGAFGVIEYYRDQMNVNVNGMLLSNKLNILYSGCGVFSNIADKVLVLNCKNGFFLKWSEGYMKIDGPAMVSGAPNKFFVLVMDSIGDYYFIEEGKIKYQGNIGFPALEGGVYLSKYRDGFLICWNGKLYRWTRGKLYASNLSAVAAVSWNDNMIIVKKTGDKLVVEIVKEKSIKWHEVQSNSMPPSGYRT